MIAPTPGRYDSLAELQLKEQFNDLRYGAWARLYALSIHSKYASAVDINELEKEIYDVADNVVYFMVINKTIDREDETELINHIAQKMKQVVKEILDNHDVTILRYRGLQAREESRMSGDDVSLKDLEFLAGELSKNEKELFKFLRKETYNLEKAISGIYTLERKVNEKITEWEKAIQACQLQLCATALYSHVGKIAQKKLESDRLQEEHND